MEKRNLFGAFIIVFVLVIIVVILSSGKTSVTQNGDENANINLVAGRVVGYVKNEKLGIYLTDSQGMTLYAFKDDKKLQGTCAGDCLKSWLPFMWDSNQDYTSFTNALDKKMNAAKTSDGSHQYAYGEKPLYYYIGDKIPGEVNGNGLGGGKWNIVPVAE